MNAPKEYYENMMKDYIESSTNIFNMLNGEVRIYPVLNTVQVKDYSKYAMSAFDGDAKKAYKKDHFPVDLKNAFEIGAELSK
jgi:hypothetical protein